MTAQTIRTIHRDIDIAAGVLAILAAAIVAFGVIPDVRADKLAGAGAVPSFWVNVGCNVLVGIGVLAGTFMTVAGRRRLLLGGAAILALLLGLLLLDAAAAFSTHGHALDAATARTFLGALADLAAGMLIVLVAVWRAVSPSLRREKKITETARMLALDRPGTTNEDNWREAVEMYNRRYRYPSDAPRDPAAMSPNNGEVGAENGDLASTRSR